MNTSFSNTNKANFEDVEIIRQLILDKRSVENLNFRHALESRLKNNRFPFYLFDIPRIKTHLTDNQLNYESLVDESSQFVVDGTMIQSTTDEVAYKKSLIETVVEFLPSRAHELVESFADHEANNKLMLDDGFLLYNHDGRGFITNQVEPFTRIDIIMINTAEVKKIKMWMLLSRFAPKTIILGPLVVSIRPDAFSGCSSLKSIVIPDSVVSIKHGTFAECSNLLAVTIPSSITEIEPHVFNGCSSLTSITIPSSVTRISASVFSRCASLTSINIPSSVTEIGSYAFYGCASLIKIIVPDSVIEIGNHAFCGCKKLTFIDIPDSVTVLENDVFRGCTSLKPDSYWCLFD
jgi:hypothetical protein